jgi:hypothetical protein
MPTPSLTAEAIIFAINSAIKISQNLRRAYAHSIQEKGLVLPLPEFDPKIKLDTVIYFFDKHPDFLRQWERLADLHRKADSGADLSPEEDKEYQGYYQTFIAQREGLGPYAEMSESELISLFKVRQWKKGEGHANVLQLVAGTLVEIGVDYFTHVPGALNRESAHGRALHQFLSAFDEIDFADIPDIKRDFSNRLLPRLFAAAAESVATLSEEIAGDEKLQSFIKATAKGIANDIYQRAGSLDAMQREEAVQWGQLVLRSMINNAGQYVLSSPQSFFGTNEPVSKIIESSGLILLDAILGDDPDKVDFRNALSPDSLDRMVRATLGVIAEHPNVISGQRGVKEIIGGVATALKDQEDILGKGFLPELARIVLEQSAGKLDLLWRETPEGPEHLLVLAIKQTLGALSEKRDDGAWNPTLTRNQLLGIMEELLDDVVQNPAWIMDEVNGQSVMAQVLEVTFNALRTIPKEERLHADVTRQIIHLSLQTALVNQKVLDKLKWGSKQEETVILTKALELVFAFTFRKEVLPVGRLQLMADLLDYTSNVILRQHPDEKGLVLLDLILFQSGIDYSGGFDAQLAGQITDAALQALASHPELVAKPQALRNILSGVAGALDSAGIKQPGILSRLVQLVLQHTALNAHLLIDASEDQPKHLLLTTLEQLLAGLSASDGSGAWKPGFTTAQVENLIGSLLDEIVRHPFWVAEKVYQDSLLAEVLNAVFQALATIPQQERLSPETLDLLLQLCLRVVATSPTLLQKVHFADDEQEKEILQRALELVFAYTSSSDADKANRMLLLPDLVHFTLETLIVKYPDKRGLILAELVLFEDNGIDYSQGFQPELAQQLADSALAVLSQHPELVTNDQMLCQIIANVAGALRDSGLDQPDLLPELIRLTLESTAEHIDLLLDEGRVNTRHLFVLAAWQALKAVAQPAEDGKWRPRLSNSQILEIIAVVYETILRNPQWALQEPYLNLLLQAVFHALQSVPEPFTVPYTLILCMVEKSIEAANRQRELLIEIETPEGVRKLRLQYSLEGFITVLYRENGQTEAAWYLSQSHIVEMLVHHYLLYLASTPVSQEDMDAAQDQIHTAIALWEKDFSQNLAGILEKLGQQNN